MVRHAGNYWDQNDGSQTTHWNFWFNLGLGLLILFALFSLSVFIKFLCFSHNQMGKNTLQTTWFGYTWQRTVQWHVSAFKLTFKTKWCLTWIHMGIQPTLLKKTFLHWSYLYFKVFWASWTEMALHGIVAMDTGKFSEDDSLMTPLTSM